MNKEKKRVYLESLENQAIEEAIFKNLTTANFLHETNGKKARSQNTTEPIDPSHLEKVEQYVGQDHITVNGSNLSVGTIIKRAAMMRETNYDTLSPSEIALVDCGLNCILDLTRGSLTEQRKLFSNDDWNALKARFSLSSFNSNIVNCRPTLQKVERIFTNHCDAEECYWNAKTYQRKASSHKKSIAYELISILIDKMIKHKTIFNISTPTPSEADIMIKVWADIFEIIFHKTDIYVRWGEKGLRTGNDDRILFKLDAKLVLLYDGDEYPISSVEFAPYSGPKKIKTDRSKLLVEAKTIYNQAVGLGVNEEIATRLKVVNVQIMGLEAHVMALNIADYHLYIASSLDSCVLPSTLNQLKTQSKIIIGQLFDLKHHCLNTAEIIKETLNDKKKTKRSMKRKIGDIECEEGQPFKDKLVEPTWRHR